MTLAMTRAIPLLLLLVLSACGRPDAAPNSAASEAMPAGPDAMALFPGETPSMRRMIESAAVENRIPASLLHRVVQRESDYRPNARNGPYYGLMQILPQTARTMGHDGPAGELLDPGTNLRYGGRYLRGAWLVADGDPVAAVGWYARGYYYEARDRCMLVETGLAAREVASHCR